MSDLTELIVGNIPDFTRPVLFLDFDDVLNIFCGEDIPEGCFKTSVTISAGTQRGMAGAINQDKVMTLVLNESVLNSVRMMNAVWLTSWKRLTQDILNPMLNFDFGYVDWNYRGLSDSGEYGKLSAIESIIRCGKPPAFAVVDDSFYLMKDMFERTFPFVDSLVIAPYGNIGISADELAELEQFMYADHPVFDMFSLSIEDLQDNDYSGKTFSVRVESFSLPSWNRNIYTARFYSYDTAVQCQDLIIPRLDELGILNGIKDIETSIVREQWNDGYLESEENLLLEE